eukprot:138503-Pelagomonas_calceolata.AAC.1
MEEYTVIKVAGLCQGSCFPSWHGFIQDFNNLMCQCGPGEEHVPMDGTLCTHRTHTGRILNTLKTQCGPGAVHALMNHTLKEHVGRPPSSYLWCFALHLMGCFALHLMGCFALHLMGCFALHLMGCFALHLMGCFAFQHTECFALHHAGRFTLCHLYCFALHHAGRSALCRIGCSALHHAGCFTLYHLGCLALHHASSICSQARSKDELTTHLRNCRNGIAAGPSTMVGHGFSTQPYAFVCTMVRVGYKGSCKVAKRAKVASRSHPKPLLKPLW